MPDPNDTDDKTVKQMLDGATRADLERWFGLPSFEQLAEHGIVPEPPPPENAEMAERRRRQDEALAAVDPAWLEAHRLRTDASADAMIRPLPPLPLRIDPSIARLDIAMLEQRTSIAEPREVERPGDISDALEESAPQALLRDLHRPESDFYKAFEWVDPLGEARVNLSAEIREAMRTPPAMPPRSSATPLQQARALVREASAERHRPWAELDIPQRRVTE